jgi:hypothetical protein
VRAATLLFLLAGAAAGQSAETAQQRGKRVVDEALETLGGQAFLRMEDRVESGRAYSFFRQELSGLSIARIYTRYVAPGADKIGLRERQAFGKDEYSYLLFTPQNAWEVTYRGARPLEDLRYANYIDSVRRNFFYILRQRLNEPGLTFYSQGSDFLENRPVEIVEITDAENLTVTVYFDKLNKLPVRQVFKRRNQQYKDFDTEVTVFSKYRDVGGGVKWPFDIRRDRNGEKVFEMFAESVEINRSLTDNLFTLPANVKLLPKPK